MKYNLNLVNQMAKNVPGEQTVLLTIDEVKKEELFSTHKVFEKHGLGVPVSTFRSEDGALNLVQYNGLCHVLVAGSTGSGKSMRFLENTLFDLDGTSSVIVVDVKGELYRNTASYLSGVYGEENIRLMDFIHPKRSQVFFNPIAPLAKKYLEADLDEENGRAIKNEALSDLRKLFEKLFPLRSKTDISWDEGARGFIYGIVYGLFEDMALTKEDEERTHRKRILPDQINFETISEIFSRFKVEDGEFNDRGFFTSRDKTSEVWRYVKGIMNDAPNTRACYLQLVEGYLNNYNYPDIRSLTVTDNFDVSSLGEKPQVLFLMYDITETRMRSFVNQYCIKALEELKTKAIESGEPLKVPVQFIIDEFPTLQADDIYPTIFSVGRGWNIFITAIVQDFTQLETTYSSGVAQQIRNNCNLTFFLGTNDINTAKAVREQIGKHLVPDMAEYLQGKMKFIETYVISEDELMHRIKPGETYVTINNHMPVKGFFDLYYNCPEYTDFPKTSVSGKGIGCIVDFDNQKYHYDISWMDQQKKPRWSM